MDCRNAGSSKELRLLAHSWTRLGLPRRCLRIYWWNHALGAFPPWVWCYIRRLIWKMEALACIRAHSYAESSFWKALRHRLRRSMAIFCDFRWWWVLSWRMMCFSTIFTSTVPSFLPQESCYLSYNVDKDLKSSNNMVFDVRQLILMRLKYGKEEVHHTITQQIHIYLRPSCWGDHRTGFSAIRFCCKSSLPAHMQDRANIHNVSFSACRIYTLQTAH